MGAIQKEKKSSNQVKPHHNKKNRIKPSFNPTLETSYP